MQSTLGAPDTKAWHTPVPDQAQLLHKRAPDSLSGAAVSAGRVPRQAHCAARTPWYVLRHAPAAGSKDSRIRSAGSTRQRSTIQSETDAAFHSHIPSEISV